MSHIAFKKLFSFAIFLGGMFFVVPAAFAAEGDVLWRQQSIYNSTGATAAPMKIQEYGGDVYAAGYLKGCVYFASTDSEWYMERRNGNTGAVIWQQRSNPTPSANCLSVFLVDSTGVYTAGYDSWSSFGWRIEKRSLSTGAPQWSKLYSQGSSLQFLHFGAIDSTGIYLAGDGYSGNPTARVLKIDKATGNSLWDKSSTGPCSDAQMSSFFHDNTGVYYGFMGGCAGGPYQEKIEKRDLTTGNPSWTISGPTHSAPIAVLNQTISGLDSDSLYLGGLYSSLVNGVDKRNKNTGVLTWNDPTNLDMILSVDTGAMYTMQYTGSCWLCAGGDYIFKKRNPSSGSVVWSTTIGNQFGDQFLSKQIYDNNTLYAYAKNAPTNSFRKYDLSSGGKTLERSTHTLPDSTTEAVFAPYPGPVPASDKTAFYAVKSDPYATGYWVYKHTLIPSLAVDCSADIVLGTQKWASCNATQNAQYWYPGVDATTVDTSGWPYGALYDRDSKETGACSTGYHVPSVDEWKEALQTLGITVDLGAKITNPLYPGYFFYVTGNSFDPGDYTVLRNALKLPFSGHYNFGGSGAYENKDSSTSYWSNEQFSILNFLGTAVIRFFTPPNDHFNGMYHLAGLPLRCIADSVSPPPSTLKVCLDTCDSGSIDFDGETVPLYPNDTRNFRACYNTSLACEAGSIGDVTADPTTTFTATNSPNDAVSLTATKGQVQANATASGVSEAVSVLYGAIPASVTFTVPSICVKDCSNASSICQGEAFSDTNGCGTNNCTGNRYCDFNWREVAP